MGIVLKLNKRMERVQRCRKIVLRRKVFIGHERDSCERQDLRIIAVFSPSFVCIALSNISKLGGIVQTYDRQ